jgi:hypothetical protein
MYVVKIIYELVFWFADVPDTVSGHGFKSAPVQRMLRRLP